MAALSPSGRKFGIMQVGALALACTLFSSISHAKKCSWKTRKWSREQTALLKTDPLESVRVVREINAMSHAVRRRCESPLRPVQRLARELQAKHAASLKISLRGSAGIRTEQVSVEIDAEPAPPAAASPGPGHPLLPGTHEILVDAPPDTAERVTVVEVWEGGRELLRVSESLFLFQFVATPQRTSQLDVRVSLRERACYTLRVKPEVPAALNVPMILHGAGAGFPLARGVRRLKGQPYSLQVDLSSLQQASQYRVEVEYNGELIARTDSEVGARYHFQAECSPERPADGGLVVRVVPPTEPAPPALEDSGCDGWVCAQSPWFWTGSAVVVAGVTTALVSHFGFQKPAQNDADHLFKERGCRVGATDCDVATRQRVLGLYDDADEAATWAASGWVAAGFGTALAVGALLWLEEPAEQDPSVLFIPQLEPHGVGLVGIGRF